MIEFKILDCIKDLGKIISYYDYLKTTPWINEYELNRTLIGMISGDYKCIEVTKNNNLLGIVIGQFKDDMFFCIQIKITGNAVKVMDNFYAWLKKQGIVKLQTLSLRDDHLIERFFKVKKVYSLFEKEL